MALNVSDSCVVFQSSIAHSQDLERSIENLPLSEDPAEFNPINMDFNLFNQALTLIFAFPASAILGKLVDPGGTLNVFRRFAFVVMASLLIYLIFLVLHEILHPFLGYSPWTSAVEAAALAVLCGWIAWRDSDADGGGANARTLLTVAALGGIAVSVLGNLIYPNDKVILQLGEGDFDIVAVEFETNEHSGPNALRNYEVILPVRSSAVRGNFIVVPLESLSRIKGLNSGGYGDDGAWGHVASISPFGFGGYLGKLETVELISKETETEEETGEIE